MSRIIKKMAVSVEQNHQQGADSAETGENINKGSVAGRDTPDWQPQTVIIQNNALMKADDIISLAKKTAQGILDQARAEGENKGFREGFEKGYAESFNRSEVNRAKILKDTEKACGNAKEKCRLDIEKENSKAWSIAEDYARKIINVVMSRNEDAYLKMYYDAVSHIGEAEKAILKTGPRGYEIASRHEQELRKSIHGLSNFKIELSGSNDGLCVIETPAGSIDASVDTQIARAAKLIGEIDS